MYKFNKLEQNNCAAEKIINTMPGEKKNNLNNASICIWYTSAGRAQVKIKNLLLVSKNLSEFKKKKKNKTIAITKIYEVKIIKTI